MISLVDEKMWQLLLRKYMNMSLIICLNSAIWKLICETDIMVRNYIEKIIIKIPSKYLNIYSVRKLR